MSASTNVAANVRRLRKRRGWSQEKLADAVTASGHAMSSPTLSKTETGFRGITIDDAVALAAALGVTVGELTDPPPVHPDAIAAAWTAAWLS